MFFEVTHPVVVLIVVVFCIVVLLLRGRTNHPGLENLRGWSYAHRGLHGEDRAENSMSAFRAALDSGYGIELDIHLLKDGNLAVIHDSALKRTTGREGRVEDLTTEQLADYHLEGTEDTIPTFREVLDLYAGKAPLIVELKPVDGNHAALSEAACKMLDTYEGVYCLESFDPRCVKWLKKNRPNLIRGQLSENFLKTGGSLPWIIRFILTFHLMNFITQPDFIAYKFADRGIISNDYCRKVWKMQGVTWTLKTKEEYDTAVKEGWIPIFEGFIP